MADDNTLRLGVSQPVRASHPGELADMTEVMVLGQIFETPFYRGAGGSAEPHLVEAVPSVETRGDGVHHRIRPRAGLHFSDGSPLDAAAIAESLDGVDLLRGVEVRVDGDQVDLVSAREVPELAELLTSRACAIGVRRGGRLVGTGPYREVSRSERDMVLESNPHAEKPARIERLEITVYPPDPDGRPRALIEAIQGGDIDLTTELLPSHLDGLTKVRRVVRIGDSTGILFMNVDRWFSTVERRQALAMALDREALAATSYENPMAYTASGLIPPRLDRSRDDITSDVDAARSYFAGDAPGRPLRLMTLWGPRPYLPDLDACLAELERQLDAVGLQLQITKAPDAAAYFKLAAAGDYDLALSGWITETASGAEFASAILRGEQVKSEAGAISISGNLSRLQDEEMDRRLTRYRETPTAQNRQAIEARLSELRPLVPIMYGAAVVVHSWRVRNIEWNNADELALGLAEIS